MGVLDPGLERLRQELVQEIRTSDARSAQRFDALEVRIDGVEGSLVALRQRVDGVEAGLDQRIDGAEARLGQQIDTVKASVVGLRQHVDGVDAGLREHIDASAVQTRRHFDVVAETLRSDIGLVAEGLAALDEKGERFRGEVREEFVKIDRRFLHLEARVSSALERR